MSDTKIALSSRISPKLERFLGGEYVYLLILAAIIGLLGGFGAVLFREMIALFRGLAFPGGGSIEALSRAPWYAIVIPPAIGGLLVGPLIWFFAREAKGHGIPEVMNAVSNRGGKIRRRVMMIKTLASALTIASGGSAGREGPIVQIGAGIGSSLGRALGFEGNRLIILLGCGAAAGMAATFNAPIGGVIVAVEIIIGSASVSVFSPIVVASVMGTIVARMWYGDEPAFVNVPEYRFVAPVELVFYVLLGVLAGLAAVAFTRGIVLLEDLWEKLPLPGWVTPMIGGAVVGGIGLFFPQVLGVGYETIGFALHEAVQGSMPPTWMSAITIFVVLIFLKIASAGMTLGSGGSGGVFAPALFVGACLGAAFGQTLEQLLPGQTAHAGAYALVGMGAVLAGATHAPITAIIMLFELTSNYTIILPLMLSCIISVGIATKLFPTSIFTTRLVRQGVRLRSSSEAELMRTTKVRRILRPLPETMEPGTPLKEVVRRALSGSLAHQYVVDKINRPVGVITLRRIKAIFAESDLDENLVVAADIMISPVTAVRLDDTLDIVMSQISRLDTEMLPVVEEDGTLAGIITRHDIMVFFETEILKDQTLGVKFVPEGHPDDASFIELPEEHAVETVEVTPFVAGKTLRQLDLRATAGLNVVGIRRRTPEGFQRFPPEPGRPLQMGEVLIVVGETKAIDSFRETTQKR